MQTAGAGHSGSIPGASEFTLADSLRSAKRIAASSIGRFLLLPKKSVDFSETSFWVCGVGKLPCVKGAGLRGRPLPKAEAPTEPAGETGGVRSGSNEVVPQKSSCYRRSSAPSLCKGGWHPKDDGRIVCTKPVIRKHQEKGRESAVESAPRSFLMNLLCSVATIPQSASQTASRLPARSALLNASVQRSSPKIRALYTRELSHTANPERGPRKIEAIGYP